MKKNSLFSLSVSGLLSLSVAVLSGCSYTNPDNGPIRLNQVGFAPDQEKTATIVLDGKSEIINHKFEIFILNESLDTVWRGESYEMKVNPISGKPCQLVDFSELATPGTYTLHCIIPSLSSPASAHFIINERPYRELTRQALRAFYHQRASMPTDEPYAEGYARPAGHPDDHVLVHASAATEERPEGTVISSPGGWYDAGDYNKYIVNSGFTMGVWLMAYEMNKAYFDTLNLNIPESQQPMANSQQPMPDMLSEALYNLRWMLTMQDTDGGVYHKLTEPDFEGFIAPDQCRKPRYMVLKTTAATLDFAATMALAARVYAPYDPDFCAQAKEAAIRAYAWAEANPAIYYDQPAMNQQYSFSSGREGVGSSPAINTGAYDDFDVNDEFYWAEIELHLLTGEEKYKANVGAHAQAIGKTLADAGRFYLPATWGNVAELAYFELLLQGKTDADALLAYLEPYLEQAESVSVFHSPYGNRESDFFWGCNSEGCCWRGVECLYAYRMTGDERYRLNAERCLNYILGQNATGFCYVTGFGAHPTSHPHHRLSASNPHGTLPGFLAGGPNPMQQDAATDGVKYPKNVPADESYLDYRPSYASNEVTINWNVTLFALSAGLDALSND